MVIYIKNMKHIKRIYEMTNNGNYTLRCLILGTELDGKYGMTVDGLEAIYHALYNGEDVYGAVEFAQYATQNINNEDFTMDVFDNLKTFIYDKISNDSSDKEIIDTIYNGDYLNYLSSNVDAFENFENDDYSNWAYEVAKLIGIEKHYQ